SCEQVRPADYVLPLLRLGWPRGRFAFMERRKGEGDGGRSNVGFGGVAREHCDVNRLGNLCGAQNAAPGFGEIQRTGAGRGVAHVAGQLELCAAPPNQWSLQTVRIS